MSKILGFAREGGSKQFINMKTTVKTKALCEILVENKRKHRAIVEEAKVGWLKKAEEALVEQIKGSEEHTASLKRNLGAIREGRVVDVLGVFPPVDYTGVYDTAIKMMDLNTQETVTMEAGEFQMLVEDEWDWKQDFLQRNSRYSIGATAEARAKGLVL